MNEDISIQRKKLGNLLRDVDTRRFAIPKLQREFVWDGPKAAKLLDSIVRGMPIGTLMVWNAPRKQRLHLRQDYVVLPPFDPEHSNVWFLMDGQQRVSVLYHVREGSKLKNANRREIDFRRVVLVLNGEEEAQVRYRKPVDGEYVSLCDVLSSGWRQRLGNLPQRKAARVAAARKALLDYPVFLMFLKTGTIDHVQETFLRINTQGMKVTTADRIISRATTLHLRDVLHEVRDNLDEAFRAIQEPPILFAMMAAHGGKEARGEALERELERLNASFAEDPKRKGALERTWRGLRVAFGKAVDYLRQNFLIVHRGFLYSDYMIAMLALFYFQNQGRGPDAFQRTQLKRWFWATTVGSRYSGRNFNRHISKDLKYFEGLAHGKRTQFSYTPEKERAELRRSLYASPTGITSAVYSLLLLRRPVSLTDDGMNEIPVNHYATTANRKDRHHIFPSALMSQHEQPPNDFNSIANICLLTAQENQQLGRRQPRSYLADVRTREGIFKKKMARHLIPVGPDSGVWKGDIVRGFRLFLRQRTELLCDAMEEEAGIRLFRRERQVQR